MKQSSFFHAYSVRVSLKIPDVSYSRMLKKMLTYNASRAPLKRNISTLEVGNAAAFLCSDLASGITGEILYVDAGFNTAAMPLNEISE